MEVDASYHQERLWFIDAFETGNLYPGMPVYHNIPLVLSIEGNLEIKLMERAIHAVVQRHEALRTRIIMADGEPVQWIDETVDFKLRVRELPDDDIEPDMDRHTKAVGMALEEAKQPFPGNDSGEPLIRGMAIPVTNEKYILVITLHHSIADRDSLGILVREVLLCYNAYLKNSHPSLAELALHYADFSLYQQELPRDIVQSLLFYWRRQLGGTLEPLELPVDIPRARVHTFREGRCPVEVPPALSRKIGELCRRLSKQPFEVLLAAFKVLLHRYTGQEEVVVGIPASLRLQPGTENVIGPISNLLVLRSRLDPDSSFSRFFPDLCKTVAAAFENRDMPFDLLVSELNPQKDMGRTALFDVLFQYEKKQFDLPPVPGLNISVIETNLGWGKYDLNLLMMGGEDAFSGVLVFNRDYFLEDTVSRFARHYVNLLESITLNPGELLSKLSILSETERHRLLEEWNQTHAQYPEEKTIHRLFEDQVEQVPDYIAVVSAGGGESLTYNDLNGKANRLAALLIEKGVGADTIVGIMVDRSVEMIIGLLGILKAGGAYLPIDPDYPEERVEFMLKDSGAMVLLISEIAQSSNPKSETNPNDRNTNDPNKNHCFPCIVLNFEHSDFEFLRGGSRRGLSDFEFRISDFQISSTNLAYIIYTSGTTGKPKGCMITHRNVVRLMVNDRHPFDFNEADIWIMAHSYCFDFSVWEMYGALLNGGGLVIPLRGQVRDTGRFLSLVKTHSITVLNQTPTAFYHLAEMEISGPGRLDRHLRYVIFGGERLDPARLKPWTSRYSLSDIALINMYGITETTVHVTFHRLSAEDIDSFMGISPVGSAIPETKIYIFDPYMVPVPVGVAGELYVGGTGVCRGYLNRPALTAEKFVLAPMSHELSAMSFLYKTGDLGSWQRDGNLRYLGRNDRQVKIRGFRIELGEIENRLAAHETVKEVVVDVKAKKDRGGDRHLCAYIVPCREAPDKSTGQWTDTLKNYLSAFLPGYMIPVYIVLMESMPLTSSRKVDRNALPEPGITGIMEKEYMAPRDEPETQLAGIWAGILGAETVGIDDNFFQLGGHSLKAAVMIANVHKQLAVKIPLTDVFTTPTIRGLANVIRRLKGEPDFPAADGFIAVEPAEEREYYPLIPAQKRLYILYRLDPSITGYNMPYVVVLKGTFLRQRVEESFRGLIRRHDSFRTSFLMVSGQPVQRVHPEVEFEIEYVDLTARGSDENGNPLELFVRPFDLERPPLLRVAVLRKSEEQHILMLDMHHIITDGASHPIFVSDFMALYQGHIPAPLPLQYKDFCLWYHRDTEERRGKGTLKERETFWLDCFEDEVPVLSLPYDYPRPPVQGFEGNSIGFLPGEEVAVNLRALALKENVTLYMLLLASFNILLSRLSGQEDVVVGSPVAGRNHADLQQIIGMFVNTLALRNYPAGSLGFSTFLREVKRSALAAFENQDYPFENLVERVTVNRDTGRNPLFDVMFVLQNTATGTGKQPGNQPPDLTMEPYGFETKISKFDLTLNADEAGDRLYFSLEYCTRLFNEETVRRFARYFREILAQLAMLKDPGIPLCEIDILSAEEKEQLLVDFNRTETAYPQDKTLHGLFEEQADGTPDRIAVAGVGDGVSLTYRELNRRSHRLGVMLNRNGTGTNTIVALMMDRSVEMAVGILGVLKAGAAYLPIDTKYPGERIDFMLKDSAAKVIITNDLRIKKLDGPGKTTTQPLNQRTRKPANLAYIIYTSGTTGRPKAVAMEHRSVVNTICCRREYYGLNGDHVSLQLFSYAFDGFVTGFFTPLLSGAVLVIPAEDDLKDTRRLKSVILKRRVTHFISIPAYYRLILETLTPTEAVSLQVVTLAGDRVQPELVELTRQVSKSLQLAVEYGVTEAAVMSTIGRLPGTGSGIGAPAWNTTVYILGRYMQLQPVGAAGQLCIGGAGIARGYLNNPEMTKKKFEVRSSKCEVKVQFHCKFNAAEPRIENERSELYDGAKPHHNFALRTSHFALNSPLYLSGDLARWLMDGSLEFLGRIDHQVKIRGFRVETGEIEHRLLSHAAVKEAVVLVTQDTDGNRNLCAYVVFEKGGEPGELKEYLARTLPGYMVPAAFVALERMPLTANGKPDRKALPPPGAGDVGKKAGYVAPATEMEKQVADVWREVLNLETVGLNDNFFDLGGNSLNIIQLGNRLGEILERDVPVVMLYRHLTVKSSARYLMQGNYENERENERENEHGNKHKEEMKPQPPGIGREIAVIGMSGRFPGAMNIDEFWDNLRDGIDTVSFLTDAELLASGVPPGVLESEHFVKAGGGIMPGKHYFDAGFFGYSPKEAEVMNPQMRIFHQCAWEALENAGYSSDYYNGLIGLYAGASGSFYWEAFSRLSGDSQTIGFFEASQLTDKDFLSTRISYKLDLKGPSYALQTACSTSLAAVHLACGGLLNRECDIALAGGITVSSETPSGYVYQEGMIQSPDGHCRAFDADARGTTGGEGAGLVVLKPLEQAIKDGDSIRAVIKGTAVNNDGIRKAGYTAPSIEGQAEVIGAAMRRANAEPESISYVETHGTATPLGDPIEMEALRVAFNSQKRKFCAVGSVKSNVGHLDSAAGVTGLIKTVLALEHRQIPPSLHFKTPNPKINFKESPFYVNTRLRDWERNGSPLRAGVSSFGIGGTNAHVIVEEAPGKQEKEPDARHAVKHRLLLLSAKTPSALTKMTGNLATYLEYNHVNPINPSNQGADLGDISYTLQVGRKHFNHRKALVCSDTAEALRELSLPDSRKVHTFHHPSKTPGPFIVFMFPGLGSQYPRMGLELYRDYPRFRDEIDRCSRVLEPLLGIDIKGILFPVDAPDPVIAPQYTQPLLFMFEYALATLIMEWGVRPGAMIGYSFGEYTAACISGVLPVEDALPLIVTRSRLVEKTRHGAMMSIPAPPVEVLPLLPPQVSIAVDNGDSTIVSGAASAIDAVEKTCQDKKYLCTRLDTSHAIHSPMMEPLLAEFAAAVGDIPLAAPQIPYMSNLTGQWITAGDVRSPRYWTRHLRETVRFADGMTTLASEENVLFIEVGPGRDLSTLAGRYIDASEAGGGRTVNLVRQPHQTMGDDYYLLGKVGDLWLLGVSFDWPALYNNETKHRIPLPTYPFEGKPYPAGGKLKFQGLLPGQGRGAVQTRDPLVKKEDIRDWFYLPSWKQAPLKRSAHQLNRPQPTYTWLLLPDTATGVGAAVAGLLEKQGHRVVTVKPGQTISRESAHSCTIDPASIKHWNILLQGLKQMDLLPQRVLHFWSLTGDNRENIPASVTQTAFIDAQATSLSSLLNLVKAIRTHRFSGEFSITLVTDHLHNVTGDEPLEPLKSPFLAAAKVISQEYPNIDCRCIDIQVPDRAGPRRETLARRLVEECMIPHTVPLAAYRGNHRWERIYDPLRFDEPIDQLPLLRDRGVYLITGGLGGVGMILARHLAQSVKARLVLTGRSPLPERNQWPDWLDSNASNDPNDPVSVKIRHLLQLEELGGNVLVCSADVSNRDQMRDVLHRAQEEFGPINGVIHAAGVTDPGTFKEVAELQFKHLEEQFRPKVLGLIVLHELLQGTNPDFCLMTSSLAPVLGGLNFTAYACANQFMDTFAHWSRQGDPIQWTGINWADWALDGVLPGASRTGLGAAGAALSMLPQEGVQTFRHILNHTHYSQLVVSAGDLQVRLDRWVHLQSLHDTPETRETMDNPPEEAPVSLRERPPLLNPYEPPADEIEERITGIWQQFFGFEVGVSDDFFELGGDSLKALTVVGRIHRELNVEMPVSVMFKEPMIRNLARYISGGVVKREEEVVLLLNRENRRKIFGLPPVVGDGIVYKGLVAGLDECAFYSFNYIVEDHKISRYIDIMTAMQPEGPYVMFGYSAGGSLAFAITKEMEKRGLQVSDLIFLDVYRTGVDPQMTEEERAHFRAHMTDHIDRKRIDFEAYKTRIIEQSEKYYEYALGLNDDGVVKANIHFIAGLDREKNDYYQWQDATAGDYSIYTGFADHNDMLDPGIIEQNTRLLKEIIHKIKWN